MKKHFYLSLAIITVLGQPGCGRLGISTGFDALDHVVSPPQDYYQAIRFDNHGQFPIAVHAFFGEAVSDDKCYGGSVWKDDNASPGNSVQMDLKLSCQRGPTGSVSIDLLKGIQIGTVQGRLNLVLQLIPGLMILLMLNATGSIQIQVPVVVPSGPGLPNGAWVTTGPCRQYWSLRVPIPAQLLNQPVEIGFPAASGISDFGDGQVRLQNGYYVSGLPVQDGFTISRGLHSGQVRVTCSDTDCSLVSRSNESAILPESGHHRDAGAADRLHGN